METQEGQVQPSAPPQNIVYPNLESQEVQQLPQIVIVKPQPNPTIVVQQSGQVREDSITDLTPILYCTCCAVFFIPFGWVFGTIILCWVGRLERMKSPSEQRAYRTLCFCMILNFILWFALLPAL